MGEWDTETLGKYVLISSAGYFESLGIIVDEQSFVKNADDIQKMQLERLKFRRVYYPTEGHEFLFCQDIFTKRYEVLIKDNAREVAIGDLEKITVHAGKCKEKLDKAKDAYDEAIELAKKNSKK